MNKHLSNLFFFLFSCLSCLAQNDSILLDFGNIDSPLPWNNISNPFSGVTNGLSNQLGINTNISLEVDDSFNYINSTGTQSPNPSLKIPSTASEDSFFGNNVEFSGATQPTGGIVLANLDPSKLYHLTIFASRVATDNRESKYLVHGMTSDSAYLNVSSNTENTVNFSLFPSAAGTIQLVASTGPNNNNTYGFFYLGALILHYDADPLPDPSLSLISPNGGEFWQVGKTAEIFWESTTFAPTLLAYSSNNGANWETITTVPAFQKQYTWTLPNSPSEECLIRIISGALVDESENHFEISADTSTCLIVVIGSSTAAGAGASHPDSAWVNRYYQDIYQRNTKYPVVNLAMGGYTSYHLLPDDATIPSNININIDSARNITEALSLNPSAIIINLPSNDAANFFPVEDQLANFALMVNEAAMQNVPTWVCTTQPRNFSNSIQIGLQMEVRDSIFAIYGNQSIDFWNGIADANGFIITAMGSGDGVHLNDAGHKLLSERVLEKNIDTICNPLTVTNTSILEHASPAISIFPNPFSQDLTIELETQSQARLEIHFYDSLGRTVHKIEVDLKEAGQKSLTFSPKWPKNNVTGLLLARIQIFEGELIREKVIKLIKE